MLLGQIERKILTVTSCEERAESSEAESLEVKFALLLNSFLF